MTRFDLFYLMSSARIVERLAKKYAARGEDFVPTNTFFPIAEGCEVQLRLHPVDAVLTVRYPEGPTTVEPTKLAAVVFGERFTREAAEPLPGWHVVRFRGPRPSAP